MRNRLTKAGRAEWGWGGVVGCAHGPSARTSASVTTLFLNRRSSSSSEEHLGLRSRKALWSGTHRTHKSGKSYLGFGVGNPGKAGALASGEWEGQGFPSRGPAASGQQQSGTEAPSPPPHPLLGQGILTEEMGLW